MTANELQEIMMEEKIDELKRVTNALLDAQRRNEELEKRMYETESL